MAASTPLRPTLAAAPRYVSIRHLRELGGTQFGGGGGVGPVKFKFTTVATGLGPVSGSCEDTVASGVSVPETGRQTNPPLCSKLHASATFLFRTSITGTF